MNAHKKKATSNHAAHPVVCSEHLHPEFHATPDIMQYWFYEKH